MLIIDFSVNDMEKKNKRTFDGFIADFGSYHKPSFFAGLLGFTSSINTGQELPTQNRKKLSDLHVKGPTIVCFVFICHLELEISKMHLQKALKENIRKYVYIYMIVVAYVCPKVTSTHYLTQVRKQSVS